MFPLVVGVPGFVVQVRDVVDMAWPLGDKSTLPEGINMFFDVRHPSKFLNALHQL